MELQEFKRSIINLGKMSYERAGRIYMEKCGESKLDKAKECFSLTRCYKSAVEAYAKVNYFSECSTVCIKGRLFYMGLQGIQQWK